MWISEHANKKTTDNKIRLYLNFVPRTHQKDWEPLRPSYFSFHLDSFVFGNIFNATPSQVLIACMAGVSNSNLSEGHILKKMLNGLQFVRKKTKFTRKPIKIPLYLFKIYNFVVLGDVRGPHKCIWRASCGPQAACLRPLILGVVS